MMRSRVQAAGALALALLLLAGAAGAAEDEIVPAGAWSARIAQSQRSEERSYTRLRSGGTLLDYLVPDATVRGALEGAVQRDVQRLELTATHGLSDTWNLELGLSHSRIEQASTITTGSADPAVQAERERLAPRTVSGTGRVRLGSLHRTVFTDRHGFVWGYGLALPSGDPASDWAGRGTLLVDPPFLRYFGLLHYTFYPYIQRSRLDLRVEAGLPRSEEIPVPGDALARVHPGNDFALTMGWGQEFGPVVTGFAARMFRQGQSTVDGARQGDRVIEYTGRLELGYGNLTEFEQGPLAFPYVVLLGYERTVHGFNTPLRDELQLSLRFYY